MIGHNLLTLRALPNSRTTDKSRLRFGLQFAWRVGVFVVLALVRPCSAQLPAKDALATKDSPAAPNSKAIQQAIADLSSRSFVLRQKASQILWNAGAAAEPALEKLVAESDDLEAVARARQILASFHLGVYPGTPRAIVDVIERFQLGSYSMKLQVAQELAMSGKQDLLRRLIDQEPSRFMREQLSRYLPTFPRNIGSTVNPTIGRTVVQPAADDAWAKLAQRDFDGAERLLREANSDRALRDLGAFLLTRNKLDAEITQIRGNLRPNDAAQQRKLAWLLRAKGDTAGAIAAAKAAKDNTLAQSLMGEMCDWKGLAALDEKADVAALASSPENAGRIARIIVLRHLVGDEAGCDAAVAAAVKAAKTNAIQAQLLVKPLLLSGRVDDCIGLIGSSSPQVALDLLVAQDRMKEALRLAKVDLQAGAKIDWNAWLKANYGGAVPERVWFLAEVARALHAAGETEHAQALLAAVADSIMQNGGSGRRTAFAAALVAASVELRQPEATDALAAKLIDKDDDVAEAVLTSMYPGGAASLLWTARRAEKVGEEPLTTLKNVRRLLASKPDATALDELRGLGQRAETSIITRRVAGAPAETVMEERSRKFLALAMLFHRYGDDTTALRYVRRTSSSRVSTRTLLEVGDMFSELTQWPIAQRAYQSAWNSDRHNAAAVYSLGRAQTKVGADAAGKLTKELALVLPLGDSESRLELIRTLDRLHENDEAARQRQVLLRTADFDDRALVQTLLQIGDADAPPRPASGYTGPSQAAAFERVVVLFANGNIYLPNMRFYLGISYAMHRQRALAALRAGKTADAVAEMHRAEKIFPQNIQLLLDCDELLRKQGAAEEADAMYRRMYDRLQADCRDFPRSSGCRNDIAWLAANLDRDLDMALANAQRAVELAPQSAGILDTLAEVHYRRGNRDEAVRLEKRCVEMDSDNAMFKDRLARFEK